MRLLDLDVQNFRAFRAASLGLAVSGPVLIVGANNAGKTALLSAIDAVAGINQDPTSLRHLGSDSPAQVIATFSLSDDERASLWPETVRRNGLLATGVARRMQFVLTEVPGQMRVAAVLAEWGVRGFEPLATAGPHPEGASTVKAARALMGGEDDRDDRLLVDVGGRMGGAVFLEDHWRLDPLVKVADMLGGWRSRYYHFRALRQGTGRFQQLGSDEKLDPSGSNLASVLHYLLTDRHGLFDQARGLITQIVPGIGTMQVRTGGGQMRVVFETPAGEVNLKDLGTGVEQLLMTLAVGLTEHAPYTLIVEEPETNLHPSAQRALLGLFQEWASDRQVVAATHSPVMLDWSPGGDRLWLVTRSGGESRVEAVGEDPLALLRSLGVRPSDVLVADRLLVLEGSSDQDVLEVWFPELIRSPRVAIIAGEGGDSATHANRLASWISQADRTGVQKVLYMRDRDELAPPVLEKLTSSETVYVLTRRELENYLLNGEAIATVLRGYVPESAPTAANVTAAIAEIAESLRQKVIINRVCRRVRPGQPLMDHELRQQLASDGAGAENIIEAVTSRLMTADEARSQVTVAWAEAEADVARKTGADLLAIVPGEEILNAVFMRFAGRHYRKRIDGPAIARATDRPAEIEDKLAKFLND